MNFLKNILNFFSATRHIFFISFTYSLLWICECMYVCVCVCVCVCIDGERKRENGKADMVKCEHNSRWTRVKGICEWILWTLLKKMFFKKEILLLPLIYRCSSLSILPYQLLHYYSSKWTLPSLCDVPIPDTTGTLDQDMSLHIDWGS